MVDRLAELDAMKAALQALEPLKPEQRDSALRWLADALEVQALSPSERGSFGGTRLSGPPLVPQVPAAQVGSATTPKQFLVEKKPQGQIEQVTCLGYYLAHFRDKAHFETSDISAMNVEAAGARLSNPAKAVNNAMSNAGYFVTAGRKLKQMSSVGEGVVEALPDRDAVKSVLAGRRPARRRTTARKAKGMKKAAKSSKP